MKTATPINTVSIRPTKNMPLDVFRACHHMAYFTELMERLPDGRVLWDEDRSDIYSEAFADAEWEGLQRDWLSVSFELPEAFAASLGIDHAQHELFAEVADA